MACFILQMYEWKWHIVPDSGGQTKGSYYDSGLGLASIIKPPFSSKWALYLEIQNMLSSFKPMKVTLSSKISYDILVTDGHFEM